MYGDYGYFGSGMSGYAHYQQAFNESFPQYSDNSYMDAEYEPLPCGSYTSARKAVSTEAAGKRRSLTYKFSSIIIFSNGKAKFDLGSGLEQQLDRFAASLAYRMICRADLTLSQREMAQSIAVKAMCLPKDTNADRAFVIDFMNMAAELGKNGNTMKYVKEFVQSAYNMLKEVEKELAAALPNAGFGTFALKVMNELCQKADLELIDINYVDIKQREDRFLAEIFAYGKMLLYVLVAGIILIM